MVVALTPAERRGALVLVLLLGLGAARDLGMSGSRPRDAAPGAAPQGAGDPVGWVPDESLAAARLSSPGIADSTRIPPAPPHSARPGAPLDLNRASVAELDALPGIGPVLARRIAEHRARHGRFGRIEELLAVRGIGPRLFERLRPLVTVSRAD